MTCENCMWARPYEKPDGDEEEFRTAGAQMVWEHQMKRCEKNILCCRFPQTVEKSKRDRCGEFSGIGL